MAVFTLFIACFSNLPCSELWSAAATSSDVKLIQLVCHAQDVMMPDVDGIELLKHVRSDEAFNSMPVVSAPLSGPDYEVRCPPRASPSVFADCSDVGQRAQQDCV